MTASAHGRSRRTPQRLSASPPTTRGGGEELHRFHAADDAVGLARGYQHLGRQLVKGFEEHLLRDADHPFGRVLDDRIRTGGDNPDQRYLFAPIRGGEAYRVWGRKGSAARIELQLYSREPYGAEDVSVGYLPDEAIASATTAPLRWSSAPM